MNNTLITGEITNTCTCMVYDEETGEYTDEPTADCWGDCWDMALEDFEMVTEDLRKSNETEYWRVEDLMLWNGTVSGVFRATKVADIIHGMTVNSAWHMKYTVHADRIEYSLSHHDAMGSASALYPVSAEEYEEKWRY